MVSHFCAPEVKVEAVVGCCLVDHHPEEAVTGEGPLVPLHGEFFPDRILPGHESRPIDAQSRPVSGGDLMGLRFVSMNSRLREQKSEVCYQCYGFQRGGCF